MSPKKKFFVFLIAVMIILCALVYRSLFGMDTLGLIYIIMTVIIVYGLIDFFL